ncbi:WD40-repeat-containing domain protein [Dimargaris cristalligena]|uniref:Peroxin-7 n=1 Tax=Dimargaris cristalligena TaxID=215637 RepID=A0A4P9ZMJ4_9FUNG|nr:WD40-repeat-containing domain protein [Dimargaris cristalligena]|eukprot:RKP33801.1 WD40-repeat-containing domain protein [Dimargaris cristalligena]
MHGCRTAGFNGYSVQFSPFYEHVIACAGAANFGLVGNGRLTVATDLPNNDLRIDHQYDTQDGTFDCSWNELNENQIASCGGDGSIKLWDLTIPNQPIRNWREHQREIFSVEWNYTKKDTFLTGSWDTSIKLWRPDQLVSQSTWSEHTQCVYSVSWCPHQLDTFASASGDLTVKLWDVKSPRSTATIPAHSHEVLSVDWNKYRPHILASSSADKSIRIWDARNTRRAMDTFLGHDYAVRRVKFSPHQDNLLASASYDMTTRIWDLNNPLGQPQRLVLDYHTEFVFGVDFNLYVPGQMATCAWDEQVVISQLPSLS